jgi:hypothetical protein
LIRNPESSDKKKQQVNERKNYEIEPEPEIIRHDNQKPNRLNALE